MYYSLRCIKLTNKIINIPIILICESKYRNTVKVLESNSDLWKPIIPIFNIICWIKTLHTVILNEISSMTVKIIVLSVKEHEKKLLIFILDSVSPVNHNQSWFNTRSAMENHIVMLNWYTIVIIKCLLTPLKSSILIVASRLRSVFSPGFWQSDWVLKIECL